MSNKSINQYRELAIYLNPHGPNRKTIMSVLARAGIRKIGIDGTGWDPIGDKMEIMRFKHELAEFGLKVHSMHACLPVLEDSRSPASKELVEEQLKEIDRLGMIGGKTVVYHACWMKNAEWTNIDKEIEKSGWGAFAETYGKAVKNLANSAANYGISVVLENLPYNTHTESFAGFRDIIDIADEPNIGLIIDAGHANLAGKNVANEIIMAGRLLMDTHFHDNNGHINGIVNDQHLPPGLGTIDWQNVCAALNQIDYPGPIVFEGVLGSCDNLEKGPFKGELSYEALVQLTIRNWRAFEKLAASVEMDNQHIIGEVNKSLS